MFAHFSHHRGNGEGQKVFPFVEVEAVDGVDQAEAGDLDEVVVRLSAAAVSGGDVDGDRQPCFDDLRA